MIKEIKCQLKKLSSDLKNLRNFNILLGIIFLLFSFYFYWKNNIVLFFLFLIATIIFLAIAKYFPKKTKHFYIIWMGIGMIIGHIMSFIILTILFYLILTPIGLLMRVLGKDSKFQKIDKNKKTYWIKRSSESNLENLF